jgi:excisionase family DNA binding protein
VKGEAVDTTTKRVFSVAETAEVLGLSRNSVYRLAQAGKIRTAKTGVRRVLLPREEIERLLRGSDEDEPQVRQQVVAA